MKSAIALLGAAGLAAAAAQGPVKVERNGKALQFSYSWPAEAAAVPALDKQFRADAAKAYKDAALTAAENQKIYSEQKRDGAQDFYSMEWSTAGETPRLLSLQNQLSTFTGGAHPNTSYNALLFDRRLGKTIKVGALLTGRGNLSAVTRTAYCKALDAERNKRREGDKLDLPEFNACPKFSDLAIAPMDRNGNGKFDAIDYVASPYLAGPYAEGEYEIELPVTARLAGALKPEYRSSFEIQRQ
jgi:hypothetical protein